MNESVPPLPPPGNVPPQPSLSPSEVQQRTWNMWCHLSALSGFVVPLGTFLGPLIVWQMKKHEMPGIEAHGKAALNFHLSMLIYTFAGVLLLFLPAFFCLFVFAIPILILLLAAAGIGSVVCTIVAGMKANDGQLYKYPLSLKLF